MCERDGVRGMGSGVDAGLGSDSGLGWRSFLSSAENSSMYILFHSWKSEDVSLGLSNSLSITAISPSLSYQSAETEQRRVDITDTLSISLSRATIQVRMSEARVTSHGFKLTC